MAETGRPRTRVRVAGILVDDGRILMESMADRELWGVPGGGLEEGESLTAGCEREYREELGLAEARTARSNEPQLHFRWLELGDLASHEIIPAHLYELLPVAAGAPATVYAFDDERSAKTY